MSTAVVLASFFVAMASVLRVLNRRRRISPFYAVAPWLLVTWLLPIGVDVLRWYLGPPSARDDFLGTASSFSPLGALVHTWTGFGGGSIYPGLLFQALLAVALAAMFHFTRRPATPTDGPPADAAVDGPDVI
jgi:hypothetical protein